VTHLLLSPHQDDEALFASYVCLRHRPLVITCIDGARKVDYPAVEERFCESRAAMSVLGCEYDHLWVPLDPSDWEGIERRLILRGLDPERVWVPFHEPNGHRHHNRLAELATRMWPGRVSFYATYTHDEFGVYRTVVGDPVPVEPGWETLKRRALACYPSQSGRDGTRMHFEQPLDEYVVPTLRLNLGGFHNPIPGFVNLDKQWDWRFEDGLHAWGDGSAEAITESHALMYVDIDDWPMVFSEIARVLQPGGVVRLTHDHIGGPGSRRRTIRPSAAVATTPELVLEHLAAVGIDADVVDQDETFFPDRTLVQQNYGRQPDVFHVEGVKAGVREAVAA